MVKGGLDSANIHVSPWLQRWPVCGEHTCLTLATKVACMRWTHMSHLSYKGGLYAVNGSDGHAAHRGVPSSCTAKSVKLCYPVQGVRRGGGGPELSCFRQCCVSNSWLTRNQIRFLSQDCLLFQLIKDGNSWYKPPMVVSGSKLLSRDPTKLFRSGRICWICKYGFRSRVWFFTISSLSKSRNTTTTTVSTVSLSGRRCCCCAGSSSAVALLSLLYWRLWRHPAAAGRCPTCSRCRVSWQQETFVKSCESRSDQARSDQAGSI